MPIIKSISGIRGIVGGDEFENLTPLHIFNFASAYGQFIKKKTGKTRVIVGRDSRKSGEQIKDILIGCLLSLGIDVIDLGMASTPTVEMAVVSEKASGGIIISASHNPASWNGLKFLNKKGEFISSEEGSKVLKLATKGKFNFVSEALSGSYFFNPYLEWSHVHKIEDMPLVNKKKIKEKNFKVVVDGINSIGAKAIDHVLEMLGVENKIIINDSMDGNFAHNPEPLEKNLSQIMKLVKKEKADLGIVVDPDVDRLAFIDENGDMFGEEYTLVSISDYVLANFDKIEKRFPGKYRKNTVSNLSSTRALRDITEKHKGKYYASSVGEINVVSKMKEQGAVVGGEGNGGIIFPPLHYGRDALVGVALFLSYLAKSNKTVSEIRRGLPSYFMVKDKLELTKNINILEILRKIKQDYKKEKINDIDGVKIDFSNSWVHLRASNTEPIIRIYAEAKYRKDASKLVSDIKSKILAYIK